VEVGDEAPERVARHSDGLAIESRKSASGANVELVDPQPVPSDVAPIVTSSVNRDKMVLGNSRRQSDGETTPQSLCGRTMGRRLIGVVLRWMAQ
jgi:hypothetical protein